MYTYALRIVYKQVRKKNSTRSIRQKGCMSKDEVKRAYLKFEACPHKDDKSIKKQKFIEYHIM